MSGLFSPHVPSPLPTPNLADGQNRLNTALARKLASGGTNADTTSNSVAPTGASRAPTLTGLN